VVYQESVILYGQLQRIADSACGLSGVRNPLRTAAKDCGLRWGDLSGVRNFLRTAAKDCGLRWGDLSGVRNYLRTAAKNCGLRNPFVLLRLISPTANPTADLTNPVALLLPWPYARHVADAWPRDGLIMRPHLRALRRGAAYQVNVP